MQINPSSTRISLFSTNYPVDAGGLIKLAPDNKIYWSCVWDDGINFPFPYPDNAFYPENMNLSVINSPDSLGAACNLQPYSFYLGGNRTYWGLPNNPDYDLPRDSGSVCDTIQWTNLTPAPLQGERGAYCTSHTLAYGINYSSMHSI